MSSFCLNFEKIIEELNLEKNIKCSSNYRTNLNNYFLEEKERKEDLCLRRNYEIWLNTLNYNKSCK